MEPEKNSIRTADTPAGQDEGREPRKRPSLSLKWLLDGSFMQRRTVIRQLPFLLLITLMGVAYIFNSNYADRIVIQISKSKKELQELRYHYVNTKAKLMYASRQSTLAGALAGRGIKESLTPPVKIMAEE
jgi:hypothetical protein